MTLLSAFGGGLWIIVLLEFAGLAIFGYKGYMASKSGSRRQDQHTGEWVDTPGNIPFYKTGYGVLFLILLFATIATVWIMISER